MSLSAIKKAIFIYSFFSLLESGSPVVRALRCTGFSPRLTDRGNGSSLRFGWFYSTFRCMVRGSIWQPLWPDFYIFCLADLQFLQTQNPTIKHMANTIRHQMQNINLGIEDETIVLPLAVRQSAVASNRFSVAVSTVNPRKQNIRALIAQMPRQWGLENGVTGRIIGPGKAQFLFQSEEAMHLVLRRAPWSFAEWMITVTRWYPNLSTEAQKIIPFWVQIRGIPIPYLHRDLIEFIGSVLAPVYDVDFDENVTRVDFVRVQLLWNIDQPLRFQRNYEFGPDEHAVLHFKYERLRNFCQLCGILSHDKSECPLRFDADDDGFDDGPDADEVDDGASRIQEDHHMDGGIDAGPSHVQPSPDNRIPQEAILPQEETGDNMGHQQTQELDATAKCAMTTEDIIPVDAATVDQLSPDGAAFLKRKRSEGDDLVMPQANDSERVVLGPLKKRNSFDAAQNSGSANQIIDRGAGGPVPPLVDK